MRYERIIAAAPDDYYVYRRRGDNAKVERRTRTPDQLRAIFENTKARMASRFPTPLLSEHDEKHPIGQLADIELTEIGDKQAIKAIFDVDDEEYVQSLDSNLMWTSPGIRRNDYIGIGNRRGDYIQELTLTKEPASRDWNEPERLSKGVIETEMIGDEMDKTSETLMDRLFGAFSDKEKDEMKNKLKEAEAAAAEAEEKLSKAAGELKAAEEKIKGLEVVAAKAAETEFLSRLESAGYSPGQIKFLAEHREAIEADETWLEQIKPDSPSTEPLSQNTHAPRETPVDATALAAKMLTRK